jgi:hypothetical protein
VLHSSLGIRAVSQCVSGFAHSIRCLLVRDHRDQLDVLDNLIRILCALDPDQMGTGPALEPEIRSFFSD